MNLKTVIAIFALLLAAAVIVVSTKPAQNELGEEYIVDPKTGDEYNPQDFDFPDETEIEIDLPEFRAATTSGDCEKSEGFFRNECYSNLALIKNDLTYCNSIKEPGLSDNCIYDLAIKQKSTEFCLAMRFGITDCLTEVALITLEPKPCEQAGFEKPACLKAVKENSFAECEKLGLNRKHCNDAVANRDTSYCENIIDAGNYCFEQLALKTSSADYCKKITASRDLCYFEIARATNNHNLCELLEDGRDNCIALIALNTNNPQFCELAGTERQSCLEDLQ